MSRARTRARARIPRGDGRERRADGYTFGARRGALRTENGGTTGRRKGALKESKIEYPRVNSATRRPRPGVASTAVSPRARGNERARDHLRAARGGAFEESLQERERDERRREGERKKERSNGSAGRGQKSSRGQRERGGGIPRRSYQVPVRSRHRGGLTVPGCPIGFNRNRQSPRRGISQGNDRLSSPWGRRRCRGRDRRFTTDRGRYPRPPLSTDRPNGPPAPLSFGERPLK